MSFCWTLHFCINFVFFLIKKNKKTKNKDTTFNNGSLGSLNDDERSETRYVMWIAEFRESSNFWTQMALLGIPRSTPVWVSLTPLQKKKIFFFFESRWRLQAIASFEITPNLLSLKKLLFEDFSFFLKKKKNQRDKKALMSYFSLYFLFF